MKKISIALFAVSVAAISQAVSVTWTSGDLSDAQAAKADITGITAYYYVVSGDSYTEIADAYAAGTYTSASLVSAYLNPTDGTLKTGDGALNYSTTSGEVHASGNSPNYSANWEQDSVTAGSSDYVLAVYVADSAFGGKYAMATIGHYVAGGDGNELGNTDTEAGFTEGLGAYAYEIDGSSAWAPVPEPTTIALLALGLAAVGLKRKVA